QRLGIELLELRPDFCAGRMPVEGNTQPLGLLHGGASAALAETVGSFAAWKHAGEGKAAVGIELNATHHRSARDGWVVAQAHAVHLGGTLASYAIAIHQEVPGQSTGPLVCSARLTCLIREA
ncbi:MAG TPA: PaaI family thioesterase, partial [Beutenbergiaceae bacterium]|nr:PaaI family thioesterase [Beutenbergiaceae bacterium]